MTNYPKDMSPKTLICKRGAEGYQLLTTLPGLPYGIPSLGQVVNVPDFGKTQCVGISRSKSVEVTLTIL